MLYHIVLLNIKIVDKKDCIRDWMSQYEVSHTSNPLNFQMKVEQKYKPADRFWYHTLQLGHIGQNIV